MLILTLRTGESIIIGEDIDVAVLGVKGNQVRIGIDAPSGVNIVGDELLEEPSDEFGDANVHAQSLIVTA